MEGKILEKVQVEKDFGVMVQNTNRALAQIRRTIINKENDSVIPLHTIMGSILEEGYQRTAV